MHTYLLASTIGAILLGAALLFFIIRRLIRLLRESVVARLPAVAKQSVGFEQPGTYILHVEHSRFAPALSRVAFSLRHSASGQEVRSWPIVFRASSSGLDTVRLARRGCAVVHAGPHKLSITGIGAGGDSSKDTVIFTRPYVARMVVLILGIILSAFCLIGGMVFTALQLVGK